MKLLPIDILHIVVITVLVIIIIYQIREFFPSDPLSKTNYVATRDNKRFRVHDHFNNAQEAANLLSFLDDRATDLIRNLQRQYGNNSGMAGNATRRLLARYNPDNLVESSPNGSQKDTSYSIDKGAIIAMCLRSRDGTYRLHDKNILTFVLIHELAHVAADVNDHPPEFWRIFQFLLKEAEKNNVIRNIDYSKNPVEYCGLKVDFNPYFG